LGLYGKYFKRWTEPAVGWDWKSVEKKSFKKTYSWPTQKADSAGDLVQATKLLAELQAIRPRQRGAERVREMFAGSKCWGMLL